MAIICATDPLDALLEGLSSRERFQDRDGYGYEHSLRMHERGISRSKSLIELLPTRMVICDVSSHRVLTSRHQEAPEYRTTVHLGPELIFRPRQI